MDNWLPTPSDTPFKRLGGVHVVRAVVTRFFGVMEEREPALLALQRLDSSGHVAADVREQFTVFFIGWLGGPQDYNDMYGQPRSSGGNAPAPLSAMLRDAWLRCMKEALDCATIESGVRRHPTSASPRTPMS